MTNTSEIIAEKLLSLSRKFGSEHADVLITKGRNNSVEVREGELEQIEGSDSLSVSLRVINNQKSAIVSCSDASIESLEQMTKRATEIANESIPNPFIGLANSSDLAQQSTKASIDLSEPAELILNDPLKLKDMALRAEKAALNSEGISKTDGSSASSSQHELLLATSNGFSDSYNKSSYAIVASAISTCGSKMERDYAFEQRVYLEDLPRPETIGLLAAKRAKMMQGAKKPVTGNYPVIFHERISGSIVSHILAAINGEAIARGSSWLLDSINNKILPENVSLIEDPHLSRMSGSRPFDAEGLLTSKRFFVRNGILKSWILDLKTSRQLGLKSTGNASRSAASPPSPGTGNMELKGGDQSLNDLLKEAGEGLMVCSLIGSSINPNNGDYSRGATGFWFKNGEITHPVNECTIAANLKKMIRNLTLANDSKPYLSRRVPSILVENMTIAGN